MATAEKIDVTSQKSHEAFTPESDGDIWYTFDVPSQGHAHFSFSTAPMPGASFEVGVYDGDGELIYTPGARDMSEGYYQVPYLGYEPGAYYLRIRVAYGKQAESFLYTFQAFYFEGSDYETERNDSPEAADSMHFDWNKSGSTMSKTDVDWYKITLEKDENVQVLMGTGVIIVGGEPGEWDPGTGKWRVTLYDSPATQQSDVIATFIHDCLQGSSMLETKHLAKGTYYIKIESLEFVQFEDYTIMMRTSSNTVTMYRLYNQWTGEHFYTSSIAERHNLVKSGWTDEGVGWVGPDSEYGKPVYRLYNPYVEGGDHHYTMSVVEYDKLEDAGWIKEGIGWHSGGEMPIYRQYNPYAETGTHNYTADSHERDVLVAAGWKDEKVAWYGYSRS